MGTEIGHGRSCCISHMQGVGEWFVLHRFVFKLGGFIRERWVLLPSSGAGVSRVWL